MRRESGASTAPVPEGVGCWRAAVDRSPVGSARVKVAERTVEGFLEVSSGRDGACRRNRLRTGRPASSGRDQAEAVPARDPCRGAAAVGISEIAAAAGGGALNDESADETVRWYLPKPCSGARVSPNPPTSASSVRRAGARRWRPAPRRRRPPRCRHDGCPPGRNRTRGRTRRGLPRAKFRLRKPRLRDCFADEARIAGTVLLTVGVNPWLSGSVFSALRLPRASRRVRQTSCSPRVTLGVVLPASRRSPK